MKNRKRVKEVKKVLSVMDKFFSKRNIIYSATFQVKKTKQEMADAN